MIGDNDRVFGAAKAAVGHVVLGRMIGALAAAVAVVLLLASLAFANGSEHHNVTCEENGEPISVEAVCYDEAVTAIADAVASAQASCNQAAQAAASSLVQCGDANLTCAAATTYTVSNEIGACRKCKQRKGRAKGDQPLWRCKGCSVELKVTPGQ